MKLSAAIEKALIDSLYTLSPMTWGQSSYMCIVLKAMGYDNHAERVESMVQSIRPNDIRGQALVDALYKAYLINDSMDRIQTFAYTSELYVWWVFDLKRKGL